MFYIRIEPILSTIQHPILDWYTATTAFLGDEWFYLLMIPLIFWAIDKEIGFRLLFIYFLSVYLNLFINGLPSLGGGASNYLLSPNPMVQAAVTFWAFLLPEIGKKGFSAIALFAMFSVSFTAYYSVGVEFFSIVSAWALGGFIVYATYRSMDWTGGMPDVYKLAFSFVFPSSLLLLFPNGAIYAGLLLGISTGYVFEQIKTRMLISSHPGRRLLAGVVGLVGMFIFYYAGTWLVDSVITQFLHSAFTGLWITFFAPFLFMQLGVFEQEGRPWVN
ncbi:hypothetical protein [Salsuginibacillus kocurii]|uniref:hypothetical protein n=1 Tax=Salsuginibacillus kocurii TaxID=427078 RepID=UPI00038255F3|nr:hypothetical protein [Salsuginibacillus kocurii]